MHRIGTGQERVSCQTRLLVGSGIAVCSERTHRYCCVRAVLDTSRYMHVLCVEQPEGREGDCTYFWLQPFGVKFCVISIFSRLGEDLQRGSAHFCRTRRTPAVHVGGCVYFLNSHGSNCEISVHVGLLGPRTSRSNNCDVPPFVGHINVNVRSSIQRSHAPSFESMTACELRFWSGGSFL